VPGTADSSGAVAVGTAVEMDCMISSSKSKFYCGDLVAAGVVTVTPRVPA